MDYAVVKRGLDVVGSATLLVAAAPLLGATAALVALQHGRPVLFTQNRPGKDAEVFRLYKFRTMKPVDEAAGLITDEQRLTPFGRLLRSTSLDELPSLVNVLRGEMSFVGPRPLLVSYLDRYTPRQARRHDVRPGITGLAQVNGRNAISWEDRFELDVQYVDSMSLATDARILWKTLSTVLSRSGVSAEGEATMTEFMGTVRSAT
ncbi:sugar transferase [Micrococcus sp. TA1]|uniref:sugar transferase n=1 Tax=Micrococcus sp. TA1 TaxID=681627 RepID=UPI001617E90F|nr:sugar transferase [Micrococcus sp. TA1]MBB5749582.1 lipopolysaccharide/colanic/teichoic acid biosynthesis glycosyltransferase [Micrococcus sp. TA1]